MVRLTGLMCLALILSGCDKNVPPSKKNQEKDASKTSLAFLHHLKNRLPSHFSMDQLKTYIHEGDLKSASRYVNLAIKTSVGNPALHVINGFIYEEMLRSGDPTCSSLAGIAYHTAYGLDPSHWVYAYLLGGYELRERHYDKAQEYLANALLLRSDHVDTLYALACASYYLHDIPVALNSIQKALICSPKSPSVQRSAAVIFAAAGKFEKANQALTCYSKMAGSACCADVEKIRSRIEDWKVTHQQARCRTVDNQIVDYGDQEPEDDSQILSKTPTVILDCYLLMIKESSTTEKGNNIFNPADQNGALHPLSVVLGGGSTPGQAVSKPLFSTEMIQQRGSQGSLQQKTQTWTQTFAYGVTPTSLTYSLNIANAADKVLEFAARPSVSTLVGELATFLNADIITGTPPGGSQLSVDAGIKMECRPLKIASNGCITLEITLTSSQLNSYTMSQGITDQLISLSKAKASTTLQVFPGQTVMVAGIKAETRVTSDSSTPLLRSIPLVQYFFSNVQSSSDHRNLLYLVTPRLAGGKTPSFNSKNRPSLGPSTVAKKLDRGGLGGVSDYTALSYILKHIERSPLFACFRSGDLTLPFWGYEHTSLPHKLSQFSSFFYF